MGSRLSETGSRECAAYGGFVRHCHTFPFNSFSVFSLQFTTCHLFIFPDIFSCLLSHSSPSLFSLFSPLLLIEHPFLASTVENMCRASRSCLLPAEFISVLGVCDWKPRNCPWQQSFSLVQHTGLTLQPRAGQSPLGAMQQRHMLLLCSRLLYEYSMM